MPEPGRSASLEGTNPPRPPPQTRRAGRQAAGAAPSGAAMEQGGGEAVSEAGGARERRLARLGGGAPASYLALVWERPSPPLRVPWKPRCRRCLALTRLQAAQRRLAFASVLQATRAPSPPTMFLDADGVAMLAGAVVGEVCPSRGALPPSLPTVCQTVCPLRPD